MKRFSLRKTLTAFLGVLLLAAPAAAGDWPGFLGGPSHSGSSAGAIQSPLTQKWKYTAPAAIVGSPIKYDFMVYIATQDGDVIGLHDQEGAALWTYNAGEKIAGAPAAADDKVVVATESGILLALDRLQGRLLWQQSLGGAALGAPSINDGVVYIGSGAPSSGMHAIDLDSGSQIWVATTDQPVHSSPAVAGGAVWVGAADGKYYGLDADSGSQIAVMSTDGTVFTASPSIANGAVFGAPGDYDRNVYAWNADSGGLMWQTQASSDSLVKVSSVATNGSVVVVSTGYPVQTVVALAAAGTVNWSYTLGDITGQTSASTPIIAGDAVFVGSSDETLVSIDLSTGALNEEVALDGAVLGALAIGDGIIYVATNAGSLYAFYGTDGEAPSVAVDAPAEGASVRGEFVDVMGSVLDANIESVDLELGEGESPSSWTPTDSISGEVDNDLIGNLDMTDLPDGLYRARVTARDQSGNSTVQEVGFTLDNAAPVFSGAESAQDLGVGGKAKLTWSAATDASGPIEYRVYYSTVSGAQNYGVIAAATDGLEVTVSGLTDGAETFFVVRAADTLGNAEANTAEVSVTTTSTTDVIPPEFAGIESLTDLEDGTGLVMGWSAATDDSTPVVYNIYAAGATGGQNFDSPAMTVSSATGATLTGLTVGQRYFVVVRAEDSEGNEDANTIELYADATDQKPPEIYVTSLSDNFKTNQSFLTVEGETEIGATLTINGEATTVNDDGTFSNELTMTNGPATIVLAAEDAGGNTAELTLNGEADLVLPELSIAAPSDGSEAGGAIAVTGLATDDHFASLVVEYGATHSPAKWTVISQTSDAIEQSGQITVWDASAYGGPYTIRVTASDSFGNAKQQSIKLDIVNRATVGGTLPADEWSLVSIPIVPDDPSRAAIFGDRAKVVTWDPKAADDPVSSQFVVPDTLSAGDAVFVKPISENLTYSIDGQVADTTAAHTVALKAGWNLIGVPYNRAYVWEDATVTLSDDSTQSARDASDNDVLANAIYFVENDDYASIDGTGTLQAGVGYFVKAFEDVELSFDPEAQAGYSAARIVKPRIDFQVSLSARHGGSKDAGARAAVAAGGRDGYDKLDAPKPPDLPDAGVSLYFAHQDWPGVLSGAYDTDYRAPMEEGESEVWNFFVESKNAGGETKLEWQMDNLPGGVFTVTLFDDAAGESVDMGSLKEYSYTDNGEPRAFRIGLTLREAAEEVDLAKTLEPGWTLLAVPLDPNITDAAAHLADDLDKLNVYQFYNGSFDSVYTEGGVDIQSGIGYWVYAPQAVTIDVTGVSTSPDWPVKVPLRKGLNLVGNPFTVDLAWGDNISIVYRDSILPLSEAISMRLISDGAYGYDGEKYIQLDPDQAIAPWKGFFVRAKANCDIIFKP